VVTPNQRKICTSFHLILGLAMVLFAGSMLSGQNSPSAQPAPNPPVGNPPIGIEPTPRPDNMDDITRREIVEMNQFLENHPEVAQQLRKDPSLIDNRSWVAQHPELQTFLQDHQHLAQAFRSDPNLFMRDVERYDRRDDITRTDLIDMSHFLDSHPEITEQLRKDPSLIDNRQWVAGHPALQQYLQEHPQIADAFRSNPNAFMAGENRYDQDNITRTEIVDMSHFLNSHPEIAEQLRKDPSLIDNRRWVADHPELQAYLHEHPRVADAFRADPNGFMRDEDRYDRNHDHDQMAYDRDQHNRGELSGFGQFLGAHPSIASELSADPSLATNKEYLASHAELNEYLQAHPTVSQQLSENPQSVMSSNWVQENGSFGAKTGEAKPKSNPNQ